MSRQGRNGQKGNIRRIADQAKQVKKYRKEYKAIHKKALISVILMILKVKLTSFPSVMIQPMMMNETEERNPKGLTREDKNT